ncbi:hypothetical protein RRG08_057889, partial [Elysia crispata]
MEAGVSMAFLPSLQLWEYVSTVKVVFLVFLLGFLLNYMVFIHFTSRFHAPWMLLL